MVSEFHVDTFTGEVIEDRTIQVVRAEQTESQDVAYVRGDGSIGTRQKLG